MARSQHRSKKCQDAYRRRVFAAGGLAALPAGFAYLIDSSGAYLVDADGYYLIGAV